MTPTDALTSAFTQYATFTGRARRAEHWWFTLLNITGMLAIAMLGVLLDTPVLSLIWTVGTILPNLAVTVRRFHDTGHSAWWLLATLIPFVGAVVLLVLTLSDSHRGVNQYGPSPKYPDHSY